MSATATDNLPDARGHFGPYGGRFVPETLMYPLQQLEEEYVRTQKDLEVAVAPFRAVIARNQWHYGATYQLASAPDAAGRASEATPPWRRVVLLGTLDTATLDCARGRAGNRACAIDGKLIRESHPILR